MRVRTMAAVLLCGVPLFACGGKKDAAGGAGGGKKITIGLAMDTLKEARWNRDRDLFVQKAEELGARVLVQAANGDDALQNSQAENLLTQGVDVLVVVPHNAKTAATIVESAHRSNVPVISYDRLILDSDVDLYISVDPTRVGELQGEYAIQHKPQGNYVLIGGAPTDNNARLVRNGQMTLAQAAGRQGRHQDRGRPVGQGMAAGGSAEDHGERAHPQQQPGGRGGRLQRRHRRRRHPGPGGAEAGGQGAGDGTGRRPRRLPAHRGAASQTMTVYKPIKNLAYKAAEVAVRMAKKEALTEATRTTNNGKRDVPSILLEPIAVDKSNLDSTVIADGFQKREDVYREAKQQ